MAMGAAAASIRDGELPPGDRPRRRVDPREPYSSRHPRRSRFRPLASLGDGGKSEGTTSTMLIPFRDVQFALWQNDSFREIRWKASRFRTNFINQNLNTNSLSLPISSRKSAGFDEILSEIIEISISN
uniref:OJ1485_B09.15 protein n=1 Tax=Oryza sativa subsp. japonica TaxID=39947 RepID=Q8RZI1_ORYSJ|nr:OJ1485_B09.15 [Oryza sativa Japonica Group]